MGNISRRTRTLAVITSAAIIFPNSRLTITSTTASAAAPTLNTRTSVRASTAATTNDVAPLTTAFSCGTRWTTARKCSTLCPTGDDHACPPGQHCYGGTSCSAGGEGGPAPEEARERQHRLERREVQRRARRRDEDYAPRFVCGGSFAAAEESCGTAAFLSAAPPHYCATGSSARCPAGTACYAAVPCPRSTHDEEPSLLQAEEEGLWRNSLLVTEPISLNSTIAVAMDEDELSEEETVAGEISGWSLFAKESSSAILGTVSALLSSRYGLN